MAYTYTTMLGVSEKKSNGIISGKIKLKFIIFRACDSAQYDVIPRYFLRI